MSIHCQSNQRIGNCKQAEHKTRLIEAGNELFKFVVELERCGKSLRSFSRCAELRDEIGAALDNWVKAKNDDN